MQALDLQNVTYEVRAGAAWITVNRPDKLNALDRRTVGEIVQAAEAAGADDAVRVLVVTGAGDKAFVAGADIREMSELSAAEAQSYSLSLQDSLLRLERSPKPVLAAINGFALGGGLELALACHVRWASDRARFGQPEVNLGLIPGAGGSQRLPRLIGRGRALDLVLTGEMIDAAAALRIGLVERVVGHTTLIAEVDAYVAKLAGKSPLALGRALEAVLTGGECALSDGLRVESALFGLCFATEDMREGTRAFLEKRKPEFKGR